MTAETYLQKTNCIIFMKLSSTSEKNIKAEKAGFGVTSGHILRADFWWPGGAKGPADESTRWTKSPPGASNPSLFQTWPLASQV